MTKLFTSSLATLLVAMIATSVALPHNVEKSVQKASNDVITCTQYKEYEKAAVKQLEELSLVTTTTTTTTTTKKPYSDDDLYVLSHCVYGEAGGHGEKLLSYVGSVVLNRVAHKNYPNTIRGVVFQKGQYACTWDGNYNKTPDALTMRVARQLLTSESVLPKNVVYQARFKQGSGVYAVVDGEYFCYA